MSTGDLSPREFPALRDFLRGYFHQDMKQEHGTAEAAARQFWKDSDAGQRRSLARDWDRFLQIVRSEELEAINAALARLGSACALHDRDELERISRIFDAD